MQELFDKQSNANVNSDCSSSDLPQCCGTGCTVCVLDYPEMFRTDKPDSEMLAMLEAIEQAQRQAKQMIAETEGDLH